MDLTLVAFGVKGGSPFISLVLRECLNLVLKLLGEYSSVFDLHKITSRYLGEKQASVLKSKIRHPESCAHPTGQSSSAAKKKESQINAGAGAILSLLQGVPGYC